MGFLDVPDTAPTTEALNAPDSAPTPTVTPALIEEAAEFLRTYEEEGIEASDRYIGRILTRLGLPMESMDDVKTVARTNLTANDVVTTTTAPPPVEAPKAAPRRPPRRSPRRPPRPPPRRTPTPRRWRFPSRWPGP